ncbi:hypothetical protein DFH07DRAFT_792889 [Mycena maculata]|uniref:Uncharacterized protein n=1 Tax=Mycena maculata TaxID=230809 RepID=A0AAD7NY17_9AGAR|nr:hypothetical protein DFH07DRAFT_792889 [Mycena maculata]
MSSSSTSSSGGNLYLFTFLATLVLLLVVSCSIIARAIFLRRAIRRQIDHAMAQGLVLAPPVQGSHKLGFGMEPKLFDVWLSDRKHPSDALWADITPISAQPVPAYTDGDHFSTLNSSVSSKAPTEIPTESLQVSVLVAMPHAPSTNTEELPEVAFGLAHSHYPSS